MKTFSSSPNFAYGYPTPGPQNPTAQKVMDHIFFLSDEKWKIAREHEHFDYIIIGTGFCSLAFVEKIISNDQMAKILILERGSYFLPEHFQNLPIPYQQTLGGLSETFPWTLSKKTACQPLGNINFQHGMIPFFGGRSIMWSSWCPRPTIEEMKHWPTELINAANLYFDTAEKLLNVIPADKIDNDLTPETLKQVILRRPIYGKMQRFFQNILSNNLQKIPSASRSMAAPLAAGAGLQEGLEFSKFSTPSPILSLVISQAESYKKGEGSLLQIAANCVVNKIHQQEGRATALDTSRGVVNIGNAKVVLAMGSIPPATLLMNSFPQLNKAGERFTAHFITSIVARIPRNDFEFHNSLEELELAAIYMAGVDKRNEMQYHVQLSILSDKFPIKNAHKAARHMPDVVATASKAQLLSSEDYILFVCAVLGELDHNNSNNFLKHNEQDDPTTNVTLQALANDVDFQTWNTMDEATFQMLEDVLSPLGSQKVEYWHGDPSLGEWLNTRPSITQRRVGGLVHEGSSLWIGENNDGVVGLDYRPNGVQNVYVTGGALWPTSGSWNPTLTMVALAQDLADKLSKTNPEIKV